MRSESRDSNDTSRLMGDLALAMLAPLAEGRTDEQVIGAVLPHISLSLQCTTAGVVRQSGKAWKTLVWVGPSQELPLDLISDCLDRGSVAIQGKWVAISCSPEVRDSSADLNRGGNSILLLSGETNNAATTTPHVLTGIGRVLGQAMQAASIQSEVQVRCLRLEEMLRIAVLWSHKDNCDELLEAIAQTATKLLNAERASIFLWDRPRHKLVGRPALGVEGNALEVDDDEGVVGSVLHSGTPRCWQAGDDIEAEVNRKVDRKLKFQTTSLLAVPLWSVAGLETRDGRRLPIGVFEVINRKQGGFTQSDISALEELATQAAAAIQNTQGRQRLLENRDRLVTVAAESAQVVGQHASMVAVRETAQRVAETDLSVLILGENGTGKEVLARSIHFQSKRKHQPFVAVNCAALVETLLESELFGHEKGAFTDAHQTRQGKFELAQGGTLFLDEVGDLSQGGQAKLLRVLEEKKIVRVGGSLPIAVDVRVLAATNQPLVEMVRSKRFREDLFFRLNIVTLNLPSLRERGSDILNLAEHFLNQFANQVGRRVPVFSRAAREALLNYSWPGNIRELRNLVERISYLCPGDEISDADLGLSGAQHALRNSVNFNSATSNSLEHRTGASFDGGVDVTVDGRTLADATHDFQVQQILRAIDKCNGNMTDAAARLGLHRSNLYRKMRQLGMETSD